jgi:CRP-like cAMP-binding protein
VSDKHSQQSSNTNEKGILLAQNSVFSQLDASEISSIEQITTLATYAPGRILYRPGDKGTVLFLLISGVISLYHLSTDGRKLIVAMPESNTCFGEVALFGIGIQSSFAEVIREARVGVISKADIEQVIAQKPSVATALLKSAVRHFAQIEEQLVSTTFKSVNAQLATLLLQLAQETQLVDGLSHEELAEHLGVYRETVSVALRDMKDVGVIELGRKHITICNKTLLQEIAGA